MPKRLPGRAARIDGSVTVIGITSENLKAKTAAAQTAPILRFYRWSKSKPRHRLSHTLLLCSVDPMSEVRVTC
jgi:hypothetical protein